VYQKFGKTYKLCSKKAIEHLYQNGNELKSYPFYLKWLPNEQHETSFQIVMVVAKRKFRLATTRNRIRRYIREAVRLEKDLLEVFLKENELSLALFLIYTGDEDVKLPQIRKQIKNLFIKLCNTISHEKC